MAIMTYDFDPSLNLVVCYYGNAASCEARYIDAANFREAAARPVIGGLTYSLTAQSATIADKTPNMLFVNGCNPGSQ